MIDRKRLDRTVRLFGVLLAQKRYAELKALDREHRLTPDSIADRVDEYGRTVVPFPEGEPARIDIQEIPNHSPRRWSVLIPLWTAEEGESDITLVTTMIDNGDDPDQYGIDRKSVV